MKEIRLVSLAALFAVPVTWSATLASETRTETVNQALAALFLGMMPLLGAMLSWSEDYRGADVEVRYGASRRAFALRTLARCVAALVLAALIATIAALSLLRGPGDPQYLGDLVATTPIAIAGGISLACFFAAARAWFGRVGVGVALVFAWLMGPLELIAAALVPTGHVRHLLGVGAALPLPAWGSFGALYLMAAGLGALLVVRIPR